MMGFFMKRTVSLLATAAILAACSNAPSATAQQPGAAYAPPRTISVSGLGEASAAPDMAIVSVGVDARAATAAEALRLNGARMRATMDKLKARGVADKDMQTQNLSVGPVYDYQNNPSTPKIVGYQATNTLSVKLRDLAKAGSVIDDAVADGANNLGGISFTFADPDPILNKAREDAVVDAKSKASLYAKAAGVTLGPLLQINDGASYTPPIPYMDVRAEAMQSKATPISVGESTLSANVTLVYEIR
jgi:uncharacterized protein YggE